MKTSDSLDVIQGDEQCRDGHYRAKQDLRSETATGIGAVPAVELDPNDSTSLQAQNPTNLGKLWVGVASEEAAGIPAIWNTMLYGIGEMGPLRSSEAFLKINQVTGFDCQSCAWPSPDKLHDSSPDLPIGMGHDGIDRTSGILPRLFWRAFVRQTDSPYIEQRLATTWEPLGSLCVRRDRSGQGELKSCTLLAGTGGPQAAAMRLDD